MDIQWFKFKDVLRYSNLFTDVVYAFVATDKVPDNTRLPYEFEDCVYIGKSGGMEDAYTFDRKDKNTNRGRYQTIPHNRMKAHKTAFNRLEEDKYCLFSNKYENMDDKILCVCFITPPKHVSPMNKMSWLLMVESEMIYKYQERFRKPLLMNIGHHSNSSDKMKNEDSYSQKMVSNIRNQNLYELCGD